MVARRPPDRLPARRRALGRGGRWCPLDPRRGQARRRAVRRAGRRTADGWRSSRGVVAGRRSGSSMRRSRVADARPPIRAADAERPDRAGIDIDGFEWSPDGGRIAVNAQRSSDDPRRTQIGLVDVSSGRARGHLGREEPRRRAAMGARTGPCSSCRTPTGGSRSSVDGRRARSDRPDRRRARARRTRRSLGSAPPPVARRRRFVHIEVHDGLIDLVVAELAAGRRAERGRGRPPEDAAHRHGDRRRASA